MTKVNLYNIDNIGFMKKLPNNYYSLALTDPPYGIGESGQTNKSRGLLATSKDYGNKQWDKSSPPIEYFNELIRVSKNQIIFGANHFISKIPYNSSCWIVWDKDNGATDFADCELAWTSFKTAVRIFKFKWQGMLQENMKNKQKRIHPTEKPIKLYEYLLENYAKKGDKIFDSHGGSMSSVIACINMQFDIDCCELDKDYFKDATNRVQKHATQLDMFRPQPEINIFE